MEEDSFEVTTTKAHTLDLLATEVDISLKTDHLMYILSKIKKLQKIRK